MRFSELNVGSRFRFPGDLYVFRKCGEFACTDGTNTIDVDLYQEVDPTGDQLPTFQSSFPSADFKQGWRPMPPVDGVCEQTEPEYEKKPLMTAEQAYMLKLGLVCMGFSMFGTSLLLLAWWAIR